MKNVVFILSKDCMSCESMPTYGNTFFKTPNIDELAKKGTVFHKHYCAGGSTSMSLTAMLSGHNPYEFKSRSRYTTVIPNEYPSIYERFQKMNYECHLIWDVAWQEETWDLVREFGDEEKVIVHSIDIAQPVGSHKKNDTSRIVRNEDVLKETMQLIYRETDKIDFSKKQFVWMHLPHVIKGRRSYMDDMEVFDEIVGHIRQLVGDDSIYLTTDHGHMNMHKGIVGYGFHVYEPVIRIPLITPKLNGLSDVYSLTSNIDLETIIIDRHIPLHKYVYCDTAYYAQPNRKLAIVGNRYKYIYNKENKKEEFYDLEWDPLENYNILVDSYYDEDRQARVVYDELYFYPFRDEALETVKLYRAEKKRIWRDAKKTYKLYINIRRLGNSLKKKFKYYLP